MIKAIKDPSLFRLQLKQMILKTLVSSSLQLSGEIKNKLNPIQLGFQGQMFDYFYHFTSRQSIDNTEFGFGIFVDLKKSL